MSRIIYDNNLMKIMSLFESLTNAKLKDCISGEKYTFIVEEGQIGKAVGKRGVNVKRLEDTLKKKVRIVEFSSDKMQFIINLIYPIKPKDMKEENGIIYISGGDTRTKGLLIGRESRNLNNLKALIGRYFGTSDIKVV